MVFGSAARCRARVDAAHEFVTANFKIEVIFLKKGASVIRAHAVRASVHELTAAVTFLTNMSPLMNGATVGIFPGSESPVNAVSINVGYPQTRKSTMTKATKDFGEELDAQVRQVVNDILVSNDATAEAGRIKVTTSVLSSFTPAVLFERCSGDYAQVQDAASIQCDGLAAGLHMGRLANIDEVYACFQEFGLVHDEGKGRKGGGGGNVVNQHVGTFNRFLQFGECARATKTAGSYGEGAVAPTTLGLVGNMHPDMAIAMDRGDIGNHTGALKERFIIFTAPRVQPHEELPEALRVLQKQKRTTLRRET